MFLIDITHSQNISDDSWSLEPKRGNREKRRLPWPKKLAGKNIKNKRKGGKREGERKRGRERLDKRGGRITRDAMTLFLKRENYLECEDITLYHLFSDIERLLSYNSDITAEVVKSLIIENVTENVFGIAKMICNSDITALQKQYDVISNPIGTLSALLREYRIAYKEKYFPASEIGVRYITLSDMPKEKLLQGMDIITEAIYGIKVGTLTEAYAFRYVINKLISI